MIYKIRFLSVRDAVENLNNVFSSDGFERFFDMVEMIFVAEDLIDYVTICLSF